tara:strand:- start:3718 stop:4521 length:804 start_codon:yes stop_codon:yes gene_type:complete
MGRIEFAKDVQKEGVSSLRSYYIADGEQAFCEVCYGDIHNTHNPLDSDEDENDGFCGDEGVNELIVFHPMQKHFNKELYDWVMSDNIFGKCFLDKDLDNGLLQGWEVDTNQPYDYLLGAMITLRYVFNAGLNCAHYGSFRDLGASIEEALLISACFTNLSEALSIKAWFSDHEIFPDNLDKKVFLAGNGPVAPNAPPTKEQAYFKHSFWGVWLKENGSSTLGLVKNCLSESLESVTKGSGWGQFTACPNTKEQQMKLLIAVREKVLN